MAKTKKFYVKTVNENTSKPEQEPIKIKKKSKGKPVPEGQRWVSFVWDIEDFRKIVHKARELGKRVNDYVVEVLKEKIGG